jgi:hypothetical protein
MNGQKKTKFIYKKGLAAMMFSAGMLFAAAGTIGVAVVDKVLEDTGFYWVGTVLRMAIPLAGMLLGVYFLEHNPITTNWLP